VKKNLIINIIIKKQNKYELPDDNSHLKCEGFNDTTDCVEKCGDYENDDCINHIEDKCIPTGEGGRFLCSILFLF
jgi:hypothetical protein